MTALETPTITPAEALAELERRALPKSERGDFAGSPLARRLLTAVLREIAEQDDAPVEPFDPEPVVAAVPDTVEPEPEVDDRPLAPVVPITEAKPRRTRTTKPKAEAAPVADLSFRQFSSGVIDGLPSFTIPAEALLTALKAIEAPTKGKRNFLPVLRCVLIAAQSGKVSLTTTDLDVTLQSILDANVPTSGTLAVPLGELKALIPTAKRDRGGDLSLTTEDEKVTVTVNGATSTIRTVDAADWPKLDVTVPADAVELDVVALASVIGAASKEETRPILTGVLFNGTELAATDTYRLNTVTTAVDFGETPRLVPATSLAQIVKSAQRALIAFDDVNAYVIGDDGVLRIMRQISGEFPNYKNLIPANSPLELTFDNAEMVDALTSLIRRKVDSTVPVRLGHGSPIPVRMVVTDRFDVTLPVKGSSPIDVAYNPTFLRDAIEGGFGVGKLIDNLKPALFERTDEAGRLHRRLIMPVRAS